MQNNLINIVSSGFENGYQERPPMERLPNLTRDSGDHLVMKVYQIAMSHGCCV